MLLIGGQGAAENMRLIAAAQKQLTAKIEYEKQCAEIGQEPRKDMLHYLVNAVDPKTGSKMTQEELLADTVLFIAAGSDTTATALAGSFFYMLHTPRTLAKATAEVRSVFASQDEIRTGGKLDKCIYLDAIMEETLRRAPPKPSHVPREVLSGGMVIDGHFIPEGTVVGVPAYSIHHNEDYYPDPWSFYPERWIVSEETGVTLEDVERAKKAFCPFSLGIRGCIGKQLAYMEYKLTLAMVLWKFDVRLVQGNGTGEGGSDKFLEEGRARKDEWQLWDCMGVERFGPVVQFREAVGG
jgi:cytochrome P450